MTPAARLRMNLAAERRRGVPFDVAWNRALDRVGRDDWGAVLEWSRSEWEAAYERRAGRFNALSRFEREREGVRVLG